jgi:hypothetical protein
LTAPEALEIRAIPGGSLLELLFGAPLINPFFALLGADRDLLDTRESPGLTAGSEGRLVHVPKWREEGTALDSIWDDFHDLLQIISADGRLTDAYRETARERMEKVSDALAGGSDWNSPAFLSDLWWVDELFTSTAQAPGLGSNTLDYLGYPPNMPPVANDDPYFQTRHDTTRNVLPSESVLNNDFDPNYGTVLTASLVSGPSHAASFSFNSNGTFTYSPAYRFVGSDNFTYRASDGQYTDEAVVTIDVFNSGPRAQDDQYTASFRTELVVGPRGVLANDNDLEGDSFSAIKVTDPSHGRVTLNADGSFRYMPTGDYLGKDEFTYKASDGMNEGNAATVTISVVRPVPDIDTDSDNTGAVERSQLEDDEETKDPGCLVWKDYFDFNANGTLDRQESGPLLNGAGQPVSNTSLKPAQLAWNPLGVDLKDYRFELSTGANTRLYSSQAKHPLATTYRIGADPVPTQIWVEGYEAGPSQVDWILKNPAGVEVSRDTVKFTVVWINAEGYRPQTEGPGYGHPFARTVVPNGLEETPGVGIRRNGDDDNGNQTPDLADTSVAAENDLIESRCLTEPAAPPPGVQFWVKRTNQNVAAYNGADKAGPWYGPTTNEITVSSSPKTGWVEWRSMDPLQTGANFELYVWDATHQRRFDAPDVLHFYPFNSVVIVLGGEDQVPSDPPSPEHGVFGIATDLYRNGYDAHMYDEDAVDSVGADYPPHGLPNREVVEARSARGVTQVAVFGYSHGGGSTFLLANRLSTVNNLNVDFTAYVDAVSDSHGDLDIRQEQRRPPGSAFHANYFQQGVINPLYPGFDFGLDGGPITNPAPGDFEINVETQPAGAPWDRYATHHTIDNAQWANGVGRVYEDLSQRLQARISR